MAIGLFVAELYTEGIGVLAVGGVIAFVLGSLMLYTPLAPVPPGLPAVRVSPWLITTMAAGIAAFFLLVARAVLQARRAAVTTGVETLVGRVGVAASELSPFGTVV